MELRDRRTRRKTLATAAATMLALAVASTAWACTTNMQGDIYFNDLTGGTCGTSSIGSATAGSTVCSKANWLKINVATTPENKYEIRYVRATTPPTEPDNTLTCHNSPHLLQNNDTSDRLFTAVAGAAGSSSATGGWLGQKVTLPSTTGNYVFCAASIPAYQAGAETGWWSFHRNLTLN